MTWFVAFMALLTAPQLQIQDSGNPEIGKRIYRNGILSSGELLTAIVNEDVIIRGKVASCAQCHRNSGYGSDKPGKIVPAITGDRLFATRVHERGEEIRSLFKEPQTNVESTLVRIPKNRPAYTAKSLIESLRTGHGVDGRLFGPLKPRYELDPADARHLIAWLKTLGTQHQPGIDEHTIHFATIVTDDVPEEEIGSYLKTIGQFVQTRNRETVRYQSRPGISPNYKDDLLKNYRNWKVHVWRLEGGREMYPLQLASQYEQQPVFAILGGLSAGDWRPVHRFCDHREIPCVFPQTPLPQIDAAGGYTIYFDQGIFAETRALGRLLLKQRESGVDLPTEIRVSFRDKAVGRECAIQLQQELDGLGIAINPVQLQGDRTPVFQSVDSQSGNMSHLLCLNGADMERLIGELSPQSFRTTWLSSSLAGIEKTKHLAGRLSADVLLPFEPPASVMPRSYRIRKWFNSRQIVLTHPTLQMKTFFLMSVTSHALEHMAGRHSRDYLIERIEHETENSLNPGIYTRLGLGPGQRFAATGGDVLSPGD